MAGRPKGLAKTGGRAKGVTNKMSLAPDLHAKCAARGIDVFELLLDFCGEAPMELRLNAIKELMKYLYPQQKAIEHTVKGGIEIRHLEDASDEELDVIIVEEPRDSES